MHDLQAKEETETKEEMKKLLIDKKDSYAKYVREMHLPAKSKQKEKELQKLIGTLHHPVRNTIKYPPGSNLQGASRRARSQSKNRNQSMVSLKSKYNNTD